MIAPIVAICASTFALSVSSLFVLLNHTSHHTSSFSEGKGIEAGKQIYSPIEITDIAPTLIHILNLQRSGSMIGQPILPILEK